MPPLPPLPPPPQQQPHLRPPVPEEPIPLPMMLPSTHSDSHPHVLMSHGMNPPSIMKDWDVSQVNDVVFFINHGSLVNPLRNPKWRIVIQMMIAVVVAVVV